jgi:hypothetical protein
VRHDEKHEKEALASFERQFTRWKLTQLARTRPTALHINPDAVAVRRQTVLMIAASLAAVAGAVALIAVLLQNV